MEQLKCPGRHPAPTWPTIIERAYLAGGAGMVQGRDGLRAMDISHDD